MAAVRSRRGASFSLVSSIPAPAFQLCLSVGLYAEWQEVMTRPENLPPGLMADEALAFVRHLASRPFLPDADDDMVLELAFAAGCRHRITHNVKDFHGSEQLGITAVSPHEFLKLVGNKP